MESLITPMMLTKFMDRYRGRRGLFGYLVLRADVWWLRRSITRLEALRRLGIR